MDGGAAFEGRRAGRVVEECVLGEGAAPGVGVALPRGMEELQNSRGMTESEVGGRPAWAGHFAHRDRAGGADSMGFSTPAPAVRRPPPPTRYVTTADATASAMSAQTAHQPKCV